VSELPKQVAWVCQRLRATREMERRTLENIGEQLGVQRAFVSNLENVRKEPRLSTIVRYVEVLGLNLETLFTGSPDSTGVRWCPSNSELSSYVRKLGIKGKQLQPFQSLQKSTWQPDEGQDWQLADEIYWGWLLAESGKDVEQVALWVKSRIAKKLDERTGQMAFMPEECE
jgi:transcriptional regulator with XRE-family HTH domain